MSGHSSVRPWLQPLHALVYPQKQYADRFQNYLLANMPTPTLQENMHLISYAQCSLKIVFLWCKVRSKFDRLSLAHSRWFFRLLSSLCLPCSREVFFCPKTTVNAHRMSQRQKERGRISVTIWETDRVSQKEIVSYCPRFPLYFLRASVQLSNACYYLTVIWPV